MAKEEIRLFDSKTGNAKVYQRDLERVPYTMIDMMNSMEFDLATTRFQEKVEKKRLNDKDIEANVRAMAKFLVKYFRNQFTIEQAMGYDPKNMDEIITWKLRSSGFVDNNPEVVEADEEEKK